MPLKYILLSDLHLGEHDSLLTPSRKGDYQLLNALGKSLESLSKTEEERPILILNGDVLGLSFSTYQESLTVFEKLIDVLISDHSICSQVIYIPGNHDHHIWQLAMEAAYRKQLDNRQSNEPIPSMDRITAPLLKDGVESEFIEAFLSKEKSKKIKIKVIYPNMIIPPERDGGDFILIHHGHFVEHTYQFISRALESLYPQQSGPQTIEELEADNGAWINFAFSELGRSGRAGEQFEKLMNTLSSISMFDEESGELSENVARALDYPYIPFHSMEKFLTRRLIQNIAKKIRSERYQEGVVCSEETMNGLVEYIDKYCAAQLESVGWKGESTTLIWGHTHKPFIKEICTHNCDQIKVVNSGGWVLPEETKLTHGGSIVLIDEHNTTESIRIWNDRHQNGLMVFEMDNTKEKQLSTFALSIRKKIRSDNNELKGAWKELQIALQAEISLRRIKHQALKK